MSSDFSQDRFKFRSRLPVAGLALLLLGSVSLTFGGCDWWPKPKPSPIPEQTAKIPADSVAIYFSKYQGSQSIVESVVRKLPEGNTAEPLKFALTELLKGPNAEEKSQGFYTEIPQGTKLLALTTQPKAITIDLSHQFSEGGGSTTMTQRLEEIKRTVKAVDTKHEINITIEGKPLELLGGEGLEVPGTLESGPQ